MPVSFARLRIAGFKSFAEPATVEIRPGLTGIVGPNGCGKSNVVEALRWAMGESNARTLRGAEMDDVIFAGTAGRASRNLAEVVLTLEEAAGLAPPPFHEQADLEIARKLERGGGSVYRVNGKELRARDVQTLFADLASGARASAMVSQGRVGALVAAKPEDRRAVLEEAAGITGLHARRHEAELKLKAAEANLARAEDLRGQLEAQLGGLKRQARQASRYRNLSGAIRAAEAEWLAIQRAVAEAARAVAAAALAAARDAADAAADTARDHAARAAAAAAALPPLREAEAVARTTLERLRLTQEQHAAEEARARAALGEAERRQAQIARDLAHAEQVSRDAAAAASRLATEAAALTAAAEAHPDRMAAAETAATAAAEAARAAEAEANRATEAAAEQSARAQAATQQREAAGQRARRLTAQHAEVAQELARVRAQAVDPARLAAAAAAEQSAGAALADARAALETAEAARNAAQTGLAEARSRHTAAESTRARLAAEARALAEVLGVKDSERWPPMVDALIVPAGLEAALGAALGEELSSAADRAAARHWRELPPLAAPPPLPAAATPLATGDTGPDGTGSRLEETRARDRVAGPPALARALSQIGLVADDAAGDAAQAGLAPGQVLVSRAGAVWRWDGYTIRAGAPTAAAVRLAQRNRLTALRAELALAEGAAAAAAAARTAAEAAERDAVAAETRARAGRRDAEQAVERARAAGGQLRAQAAGAAARLAAVEQRLAALAPEQADAAATLARAEAAFAALPDIAALRAAVGAARAALAAARGTEAETRSAREALAREDATRTARLRSIGAEQDGWRDRAADAAARVTDLAARQREATAERATLADAPARAAAARAEGQDALAAAEAAHRRAAAALATADRDATATDRDARAAETAVAAAREQAVRTEAAAEAADHAWGTVAERILDRLGATPVLPEIPADLPPDAEDKARRRHDRLVKEREEMGPVNLRAEIEAGEIEQQIAAIDHERAEITTAIAKLRGSIGHLNREGRERLAAVFAQVDRHFQALFSRMFGGGRAHLALVGSDDPLAAGLEIYAQPPGKKLATLSLLSGGEQALTALSLIFAVFRCNPAPVCVLDEVDAPLDDANVERFCALLEDMVRETATRFLVVTHHPLTMGRMDRLYGVTMQERGVSRLLSVDLGAAVAMVEPARLAAE
ncbi:MAG: chromosome segregation protein SMC [Proteobacteria bacterium]|nr:chromosome segregation protein SMC [Pseudomonadota bacterium]